MAYYKMFNCVRACVLTRKTYSNLNDSGLLIIYSIYYVFMCMHVYVHLFIIIVVLCGYYLICSLRITGMHNTCN